MLKYKYICPLKYTETILSNSSRKLLRFEMLIAVKNKFVVLFIVIFDRLLISIACHRAQTDGALFCEYVDTWRADSLEIVVSAFCERLSSLQTHWMSANGLFCPATTPVHARQTSLPIIYMAWIPPTRLRAAGAIVWLSFRLCHDTKWYICARSKTDWRSTHGARKQKSNLFIYYKVVHEVHDRQTYSKSSKSSTKHKH